MLERVNPELLKKAAELCGWVGPAASVFSPLERDEDAWALAWALQGDGWEFKRSESRKVSIANHEILKKAGRLMLNHESWSMNLLQCISAQFSIPLYLEGGE